MGRGINRWCGLHRDILCSERRIFQDRLRLEAVVGNDVDDQANVPKKEKDDEEAEPAALETRPASNPSYSDEKLRKTVAKDVSDEWNVVDLDSRSKNNVNRLGFAVHLYVKRLALRCVSNLLGARACNQVGIVRSIDAEHGRRLDFVARVQRKRLVWRLA